MIQRFNQFTELISDINRSIQKLERTEMEACGYRGAYAHYLMVLSSAAEGLSLSALCERCDRDKAAVSRIISEMQAKELVNKEGTGYKAKFSLSEKGRQAADFVCSRAQKAVEVLDKAMNPQQREAMYTALTLISESLERLTADGIPEGGNNNGQNSD